MSIVRGYHYLCVLSLKGGFRGGGGTGDRSHPFFKVVPPFFEAIMFIQLNVINMPTTRSSGENMNREWFLINHRVRSTVVMTMTFPNEHLAALSICMIMHRPTTSSVHTCTSCLI